MEGRRGIELAGIGLALALGLAAPAAAAPGDVITITEPRLAETGALAADFNRGVYWTTPAHPETGTVYALGAGGELAGEVQFDATPATVEGMAVFNGMLYLGDVGDPHASRPAVRVLRLESLDLGTNAVYSEWTLHYPDGPQDAKTFMVSPRGNFWIVTYGAPGKLYYAQAPAAGYGDLYLELVAEVPSYVTDGSFIDGSTAVLRTYNGAYTIDMTTYAVTAAAELPAQPRGESVTQALDGAGLLVGSADDDRLLGVSMPAGWVDLPVVPSAPGPLPTPSAEPGPTEEPTATTPPPATEAPTPNGGDNPLESRKVWLATGIAALASLIAAGAAYLGRGQRPSEKWASGRSSPERTGSAGSSSGRSNATRSSTPRRSSGSSSS